MSDLETVINDNFDSQLVELLYSIDCQEDVRDVFMGIVRSDGEEHDTAGVEHRVARLLEEISPVNVKWPQLFLGGVSSGAYQDPAIRFSKADKRHFELNGISVGRFFTKLVYDKLPIEWGTEGESTVRLSFAVEGDYILDLVGKGRFDTSYVYDQENADLNEDEPIDSEIIYEMSFTANLLYCPPLGTKQ